MSFVNRQLYKQKPQAWGPVSAVKASIFENAERVGIDPGIFTVVSPFWEKAGDTVYNYINIGQSGAITTATWANQGVRFDALTDRLRFPPVLSQSEGFLFLEIVRFAVRQPFSTWLNIEALSNNSPHEMILQCFKSDYLTFQPNVDQNSGDVWNYGIYTDVMPLNKQSFISASWKNTVGIAGYVNGKVTGSESGDSNWTAADWTASELIGLGNTPDNTNTETSSKSHIGLFICGNSALSADKHALIADNPYFLLHRVPPVFYSVPGGAITITTSLDGKVIIRTTTSALLDCMASIKNNASNILDGAAVVSTTKTDAIDGKAILKNIAALVFDSKASVLSVASLLLDGNAIVSDTGSALLDGKGAVKDSAYDLIDGKSIIKSTNTAILDGKSIFLSAGTTVIDGKIIVNADGFSSSLLDGKISIKSVVTNYLDGLIYIGNAADKNIDGKAIIKSSVCLTIDGKTTIQDVASNLLDGSASILTSIANIVDGKIIISDAAIGLLDGEAVILDDSSIILDGKVFLSSGSEINIFDGKITLSVPIVGKVTVSFSMRSPSVSFAIRTPAATVSIN